MTQRIKIARYIGAGRTFGSLPARDLDENEVALINRMGRDDIRAAARDGVYELTWGEDDHMGLSASEKRSPHVSHDPPPETP